MVVVVVVVTVMSVRDGDDGDVITLKRINNTVIYRKKNLFE